MESAYPQNGKRHSPGNIVWPPSSNNAWSKYYSWTFQLYVLIPIFAWASLNGASAMYNVKIPDTSVPPSCPSSSNLPPSWSWFLGPWTFSQYLWHKHGDLLSKVYSISSFFPHMLIWYFQYLTNKLKMLRDNTIMATEEENMVAKVGSEFQGCQWHFPHPQTQSESHKACCIFRRMGYWMWSNFESIGITFKYQTLFYNRTAYGMKVIIHLNEHGSFPMSKLCWTNTFKYLLWVCYSYAAIEWVFNNIKISINFLPDEKDTIYIYIHIYIFIHDTHTYM